MKQFKTVLITGANGFLGTALTEYFVQKGWRVIGLIHGEAKSSSSKVSYHEYSLTDQVSADLFKGVDYFVHTAYVKQDVDNPNAMDLNVFAAKQLLAASSRAGVKRRIFISSMSAHSGAISVYGKQKLAIEKLFNSKSDVNIRSGLILGNGGLFKQMADHIKTKRIVPLIDGGKQPLQFIGINDLVKVIDTFLGNKLNGTFTVAHPKSLTNKEFYQLVAAKLGVKAIYVPVPFGLLRFVLKTASKLHLPLGVNEENLLGLIALRSADTTVNLKKLGVELQPVEDVIAQIEF